MTQGLLVDAGSLARRSPYEDGAAAGMAKTTARTDVTTGRFLSISRADCRDGLSVL